MRLTLPQLLEVVRDRTEDRLPPDERRQFDRFVKRAGFRRATAVEPAPPAALAEPARARRMPRGAWVAVAASVAVAVGLGAVAARRDRDADRLADRVAAAEAEQAKDAAARAELEAERAKLAAALAVRTEPNTPGLVMLNAPAIRATDDWRRIWARNVDEDKTATENLRWLDEKAPPDIRTWIASLRALGKSDAEILASIRPTAKQ